MKLLNSAVYQRVTNGFFAFVLAISSLTAIGPFLFSQNASALAVTPGASGWFNESLNAGTATFVVDAAAPAGVGALALTTTANSTDKAAYFNRDVALMGPLSSVNEISYATKQISASFAAGTPSFQLPVFLGGTTGFTTLVYEPYVSQGNGAIVNNVWQTWDVDQGRFYSTRSVTVGANSVVGSQGSTTYTLAELKALFPGANTLGFGVNVGSNNLSYDTRVDNLIFNGVQYDFEPTPTATPANLRLNGTQPCGFYTNINSITPTWDAVPGAASYNYTVTLPNGSTYGPVNVGNVTSVTGPFGATGTSTFSVQAVGSNGTVSAFAPACAVTYDPTAPSAPLLSSPMNNAIVNGASVTQSWTTTDTDVDYYIYESYNNAAATSLRWSEQFNTTSKTATNVANAMYWWRVKAVDFAGNQSAWSELWKITIDNNAPGIVFTGAAPADGSFIRGTVAVDTIITDANPGQYDLSVENGVPTPLGLTSVALPVSGATNFFSWNTRTGGKAVADGQHTLKATTVDQAGNRSTITRQVTVDNTRPQVTLTVPTVGAFNPTGITLEGIDALGLDRLTANIYDATNTTLIRSCSSTVSPLGALTGTLSCSVSGLSEATYTVRANARDRAGNVSNTLSVPFTVDSTAPVVALTSPSDSATVNDPGVLIEGSTGDAVSYELFIDGILVDDDTTAFSSYNWDTTLYQSGSYVIELVAEDAAGNSSSDSITVTLEGDPQVAIDSSTSATATPTVTGTIDDDDATLELTVDGGAPIAIVNNGSGTWSYTFPALTGGTYALEINATDLAGNTSTANASLVVSIPVAPTVVQGTDTTPTPLAVVTPTIATPPAAAVLGDTTADPAAQSGEADVEGVATVAQAADTDTTDGSLFGLAWYWWVLIVAAAAGLLAWLIAALRRRNQEA